MSGNSKSSVPPGTEQDDEQKLTSPNPRDSPQNRNHNDFQTGKSPPNTVTRGDCSNDSGSSTIAPVKSASADVNKGTRSSADTTKSHFGRPDPKQEQSNKQNAAQASDDEKKTNDPKGHFGRSKGTSSDEGSSGSNPKTHPSGVSSTPAEPSPRTRSSADTTKSLFGRPDPKQEQSNKQNAAQASDDEKKTNDPKGHFGRSKGTSSDEGSSGSDPKTHPSGVSSTPAEPSPQKDTGTGRRQSITISKRDKSLTSEASKHKKK